MVTQNTERRRKNVFCVDLNICLKLIKLPISLYTCATISELPSNISTMKHIFISPMSKESLFCIYHDEAVLG